VNYLLPSKRARTPAQPPQEAQDNLADTPEATEHASGGADADAEVESVGARNSRAETDTNEDEELPMQSPEAETNENATEGQERKRYGSVGFLLFLAPGPVFISHACACVHA
jgi:hypothetical protein